MFGLRSIKWNYFLDILKHLIFCERNPGLSENLYGILPTLKQLKVNISAHFSKSILIINFLHFIKAVTRVGGNKKGVFTRNRQPKAVAHLLRKRYFALGREMDQCNFPDDLFTYITDVGNSLTGKHDEADL